MSGIKGNLLITEATLILYQNPQNILIGRHVEIHLHFLVIDSSVRWQDECVVVLLKYTDGKVVCESF